MERWYREALETRSWGNKLDEAAARWGNRPFLVFEDRHISFGEFREQVDTAAKGMLELGIKRGDIVGIWMANCPEWIVIQYAVYKVGGAIAPISSYFKQPEVEYALRQADISTLFTRDSFLGGKIDALAMFRSMCPEVETLPKSDFRSASFPQLRRVVSLGGESLKGRYEFTQLLEMGSGSRLDLRLREAQSAVDPFDVCNIMFTSGTTGFPKGGMSMHITNLCSFSLSAQRFGCVEESAVLLNYPIFSNAGSWIPSMGLTTGCRIVMLGEHHGDGALGLEAIERHGVTHVSGTPAHYASYFDHPDRTKRDLSSWQVALCATPSPVPSVQEEAKRLGLALVNAYGLSECGGVATQTLTMDSIATGGETVGFPIPSARIKLVNPDTGKRVTPGEPGECWLHDVYPGSCVGKGYYKAPEKTREVITEDGWFRTGDLLMEREDGYYRFAGRVKDMLKVGGFNVYAAEVEAVLLEHPRIAETVVIGIPDERLTEVPVAWIRTRDGRTISETEVREFLKARLASYKLPRHLRFYQSGELPMTSTEKVQKTALQEITCRELGLQ